MTFFRNRLRSPAGLIALLLSVPAILWADITVGASLQPQTTNVGEPVQLSITVNGSQKVSEVPAVKVDGAQVQYLGQNTQIQLINTALTISLTHRYLVSPGRIGELEIPPVDVLVEGKRYQTAALKLKVLDVGQEPGAVQPAAPFAEIEIPKRPVYVGESFPVEVRLLVPSDIRWRIEKMPDFETDAFTKTAFQQPQQNQQVRDGREFDTCRFRTTLTAIKSGRVPLGPLTFSIQAAAAKKRSNNAASPFGGVFDGFPFDNQPTVLQERKVILPEQTVEVRELPTEGKPEAFRGAIGKFRFSTSAGQAKVKAGEPLVMTLQIEGEGNFDRIEAPPLVSPEGWRAYPAEVSFTKSDDTGMHGVKTFRIALVPEKKHTRTPQFEFAQFDAETGTYQTQQSGVSPLSVEGIPDSGPASVEAPRSPEPKVEPKPNPEPEPLLAEKLTPPAPAAPFWQSRGLFWGLQAALVVLLAGFAAAAGVRRKRERHGPVAELLREARAIESRLAAESHGSAFFEKAVRVVQLRVAARTTQPVAAVDSSDAAKVLGEGALGVELHWLFDSHSALRFAGSGVDSDLKEADRQRALQLLSKIR